jgi:hypothetical protein
MISLLSQPHREHSTNDTMAIRLCRHLHKYINKILCHNHIQQVLQHEQFNWVSEYWQRLSGPELFMYFNFKFTELQTTVKGLSTHLIPIPIKSPTLNFWNHLPVSAYTPSSWLLNKTFRHRTSSTYFLFATYAGLSPIPSWHSDSNYVSSQSEGSKCNTWSDLIYTQANGLKNAHPRF